MTEGKLTKFLNKPVSIPSGKQLQRPAVLSDSKGKCLEKEYMRHPSENGILWWAKGGAKIEDSTRWLKSNISRKIINHGDIWLYVWLGTCNLTTLKKPFIKLTTESEEEVCKVERKIQEIIKIVQKYPGSKVTILETPVYSIEKWNRDHGHKDPSSFADQDIKLQQQIFLLNNKIRQINRSLGNHSPEFSSDIYKTSKCKSGQNREAKSRNFYNFKLLRDGVHPGNLLGKVWLRKITEQTKKDCWENK